MPGTFVDEHLKYRHADVLFRTRIDGRAGYLYMLIEHQRSPDPLMAFRMAAYQLQIWNRHLAETMSADPNPRTLPLVVPVVIYVGNSRWTVPTDLADLLDIDADLGEAVGELRPHVRYLLDDLTIVDRAALLARPLTSAVRVTFVVLGKAPGDDDVTRWLPEWADDFRVLGADPAGQPLAEVLKYLVVVSNTPVDRLQQFAADYGPEAEEAVVTTGQQLIAEGEARGRAEGVALGRVEAFLEMLGVRFGTPDQATRARVRAASDEQVQAWFTRLVQGSATLDDVFA